MNLITIIGIAASALTAISLLPQLIKLIKEKKAEDVSMGMLLILLCGLGLWIYYGILKKDWIIIIANSFSLLINIIVSSLTIKYKRAAKTA
ncbi:MAG: SemiSWEET transporter [Bacteroidota bacterium]